MKIEFSKFEVELLDQSLSSYETEPITTGFSVSILTSMFAGAALPPEDLERRSTESRERAKKECSRRRLQVALLRAKLLQALAIDSEHSVEENPLTPPPVESK